MRVRRWYCAIALCEVRLFNLETCALVSPDGSVDWFPFPHLESPSILAAILDADRRSTC